MTVIRLYLGRSVKQLWKRTYHYDRLHRCDWHKTCNILSCCLSIKRGSIVKLLLIYNYESHNWIILSHVTKTRHTFRATNVAQYYPIISIPDEWEFTQCYESHMDCTSFSWVHGIEALFLRLRNYVIFSLVILCQEVPT